MRKNIFKFVFFICSFFLYTNIILAQTIQSGDDLPEVVLERTEIRVFHSDIVEQDYELFISLPYSYLSSDSTFPVIFLLDPYRAFSMMKGFSDALATPFQVIPEVILVGIGYGGKGLDARLNYAVGRVRDYTPIQDSETEEWYENAISEAGINGIDVISGKASFFLEFIREELFPYIESNYQVDTNNRMLSGYSFGGTFCLYTLFNDPGLFDMYFIGSPDIGYKDGELLKYEAKYASTHADLRAKVFFSVGGKEKTYSENLEKMIEKLNSRDYKNLSLSRVIFENEDHSSCYPAAMSRSLLELFNKRAE